MHTWPESLLQAFPLPPPPDHAGREHPRVQPTRPWWIFPDIVRSEGVIDHHKVVGRRSDGARIVQIEKRTIIGNGPPGQHLASLHREVPRKGSWQAVRAEVAAELDAKYPMAHPGFRPGQVWALVLPSAIFTGVLDRPCPSVHLLIYGGHLPADPPPPVWSFGGQELSHAEVEHLFMGRRFPPPGLLTPGPVLPPLAYLIADPACPWLAPWSPAVASSPSAG